MNKGPRRDAVEKIFNAVRDNLGMHDDIMPFPPIGDDGDGDGSTRDLAQMVLYGATTEFGEKHIEFAIQLGRELQFQGL